MKSYTTGWSVVSVTGPDAAAFLHNFCTNDINRLTPGDTCEAFFTDAKAHILAHTVVCRTEDGYRVVVTSARAAELVKHLERYHFREELKLSESKQQKPVLLFGDDAAGFAIAGLGAMLSFDSEALGAGETLSGDQFQAYRIERGFPLDQVDIDEKSLPQELNRDALAISFTKGCYLGQEPVARIDALGHANRKLVPLQVKGESSLSPGDELSAKGKPVGSVTSVAWSESLGAPIALAYVRRGHEQPGKVVESPVGKATVLKTK